MREIKFRCWDNFEKKMLYVKDACLRLRIDGTLFEKEFEGYYEKVPEGQFEINQYTGVKDKNGKEIYEGDILEIENHRGWVAFEGACFYLMTKYPLDMNEEKYIKRYLELGKKDVCYILGAVNFAYEITVIGNIYENSNMLAIKI